MIYKYKATIKASKLFMREYEINGDISLYSLHEFLINDLEFAPDQMVVFRGLDSKDKLRSEYGLFDMGDGSMDSVTIEKAIAKGETTIHYVFDLNNDRALILTLVGEVEKSMRASYPRLVAEKGRNPDQFSKSYEDFEQYSESAESNEEAGFMDDELPEGEAGSDDQY